MNFYLRHLIRVYSCLFVVAFLASAAAEPLSPREWKVDGATREALLHIPADTTNAAPVVFAFHGHGGSMRGAARMFHIETLWPEAIVVYMQGLNTPGQLTDPEGKRPGWQKTPGDQDDRDLKFFDAVLASLKKDHKVDTKRIFSTGHSNGGGFTYLLWATRGEQFTAFAPSASIGRTLLQQDKKLWDELMRLRPMRDNRDAETNIANKAFIPKPVLHLAGDNDPLVKYEWQKLMIAGLRNYNQCAEGKPWETDKRCTIYESKIGAPVITYIHQGKHSVPVEVPEIVVKFLKSSSE